MATSPKAVPKAPAKGAADATVAPIVPKAGNKLILILVVLVLLAAAVGGGAWYFVGQQKAPGTAAKEAATPAKPPVFLVMEPFTVNLQPDGMGDQYLQVAFSLQVADEADLEAFKSYQPQLRSRLLMLLSGKKASEISTVDGKKALANEILEQARQPFVPGSKPTSATNVFFTSFVIQ